MLRQLSALKGLIPLALVVVGFEALCVWQVASALLHGQILSPSLNVTLDVAVRPFAYRISLIGWIASGLIGLALIGFVLWLAIQVFRHQLGRSK